MHPFNNTGIQKERGILSLLTLALLLCLFFIFKRNMTPGPTFQSPVSLPFVMPSPTPTQVPVPTPQTTEILAPDGLKTLTMKKTEHKTRSDYAFSISRKTDPTKKDIFSVTKDQPSVITVPFNTWSPDDSYFFINETGEGYTNYYIFSSEGTHFALDVQYINLNDAFSKKFPDWKIQEVTGWAGPNLLLVNTLTEKGESGPSLWFDIYSQSFIRLSTKFN